MSDLYRSLILSDTPTGYYRLDETSGTTALDSSPNLNNSIYFGTPLFAQSPLAKNTIGTSVKFNGTNTYLSNAITWSGSFATIEGWITIPNNSQASCLFSYQGYGLGTVININGFTNCFAALVNGNFVPVNNNLTGLNAYVPVPTDGLPHYYVLGIKLTNPPTFSLWIDGINVAANLNMNAIGGDVKTGHSTIGGYQGVKLFNGTMDEIAYYGFALSQSQINRHFAYGKGNVYTTGKAQFANEFQEFNPSLSEFTFDALRNPIVDLNFTNQAIEQPIATALSTLSMEILPTPSLTSTINQQFYEWLVQQGLCAPQQKPLYIYTNSVAISSSLIDNPNFNTGYYYRCPTGTLLTDNKPVPKYDYLFEKPYIAAVYPSSDIYAGNMLIKSLTGIDLPPIDLIQLDEITVFQDIQRIAQSMFAM